MSRIRNGLTVYLSDMDPKYMHLWIYSFKVPLSNVSVMHKELLISVAVPDPGSAAFLTLGSGIQNRFFPDLGSRIPNPYF